MAVGRHQGVRPTSHFEGTLGAHVEGGSGRPEASPTAILQDTHSVEGVSLLKSRDLAGRQIECESNTAKPKPKHCGKRAFESLNRAPRGH